MPVDGGGESHGQDACDCVSLEEGTKQLSLFLRGVMKQHLDEMSQLCQELEDR